MKKEQKPFYTVQEVHDMGFLPHKSVISLRRLCQSGVIKTVRNPSPKSHIYVPADEVERLRKMVERNVQDVAPVLKKKTVSKRK